MFSHIGEGYIHLAGDGVSTLCVEIPCGYGNPEQQQGAKLLAHSSILSGLLEVQGDSGHVLYRAADGGHYDGIVHGWLVEEAIAGATSAQAKQSRGACQPYASERCDPADAMGRASQTA